jgi:hypothetical protein
VDVGDDSSSGDGGLDQGVQLLVSSDGELQVSRRDSLHLQVLGGVTGQLEDLSGEVLKDGSGVNCRGSSDSGVGANSALQESVDSSYGELKIAVSIHHLMKKSVTDPPVSFPSKGA